MADDKKTDAIHFDREVLEGWAKAAAEDDKKWEAAQIKSCFKDCSNSNCPIPREGPDAYMHTRAQVLECLSKMEIKDGKEIEIMPGVFASNPPLLYGDKMDNDKKEPQEVQEAKEILRKTPVLKEGDKISFRQIAEDLAQLSGDNSEENIQQHLKWVEWENERKKSFSLSPAEKVFVIFGLVLVVLGVMSMVVCLFGAPTIFLLVGKVLIVAGISFGALVGLKNSFKQITDLPPPPPLFKLKR